MRLIIVRHGRTASNVGHLLDTAVPGAPLDETGLAQAEALVEALAPEPLEAIVASDLVRAQQTAAPLALARGLDVTVDAGIREIQAGEDEMSADFGRYMGTLKDWADGNPHAKVPGGESAVEFFSRYDDAVRRVESAGPQSALLVSHGAAIRTWVGHHAANLPAGYTARVQLENTAVIVLDGGMDTGWTVHTWCGLVPEEVDQTGWA